MLTKKLTGAAGIMAVGMAVGQGAILLATPYLARTYSIVEFGSLAQLMTICNIATAIGCLRFDLAIPGATTSEARGLFLLSLGASTVMALLGVLISKLFLSQISSYSISNSIIIFLAIFLTGFSQATFGYALHKKNYRQIGNIRALQGLGFVSIALTPLGLLWSQSLSYLTALLPFIFLKNKASDLQKISLKEVLRKYKEFPMLSMPGAMLDVVGYSVCIWIISFHYGVGSAGEYSQIQRIVGAPLMLVGISIAPLVLSKSIEYLNDLDRLNRLFWTTLALLIGIALILVCTTALVGEEILRAILGDAWRVNCLFITPIALAVAVRGCVSPLSGILIAKKRFGITLLWQALYLCSSLFFLGFLGQYLIFENFVILYALHELALYTIYIYFIYKAL